ncbi:DUF3105 domain-containing protein [Pseudonocardiaceae bacterium YIM PH 21723]|nr:DUF3105 domain-containing protein [Pseudonocardiaceae bacterium YIM PH 21723]
MSSSDKSMKALRAARIAGGSVVAKKPTPWGLIAAIAAVVVFAGTVFGFAYTQFSDKASAKAALSAFLPSEGNQDPSTKLAGVTVKTYTGGRHVKPNERVAYDQSPPFGGPHDGFWAACNGIVYEKAVRNENMVHALEHGAVWIAYNPDKVKGNDLEALEEKVKGEEYMLMSPYPNLDRPVSLQSWGHQLKLDSATDPRVDQFISALRANRWKVPEPGGRCDALGKGAFNPDDPPAFVGDKPGKDAIPMDGGVDISAKSTTPSSSSAKPSSSSSAVPAAPNNGNQPQRPAPRPQPQNPPPAQEPAPQPPPAPAPEPKPTCIPFITCKH